MYLTDGASNSKEDASDAVHKLLSRLLMITSPHHLNADLQQNFGCVAFTWKYHFVNSIRLFYPHKSMLGTMKLKKMMYFVMFNELDGVLKDMEV